MPETLTRVPFPLFVGCGRSGTTLIRSMFNAHPQIAIPPEAYFPLRARPAWFGEGGDLDPARVVDTLEAEKWYDRMHLEPGVFAASVAATAPQTYPDVLRALYRCYADAQGKPRYGNKTPKHVYSMPELDALFPEARFVHIIRDGRDVALSYLDQRFGPSDIPTAARVWSSRVAMGRASGQALGPQRYAEVRYEDVLDDPEREMRRLCTFLSLDYDAAMLSYHKKRDRPALRRDPEQHLSKPPTKGLRDWSHQMSREDTLLFDAIAGDTLTAFGYEVSGIQPSRGERMRTQARELTSDARRRMRLHRRARTEGAGRG